MSGFCDNSFNLLLGDYDSIVTQRLGRVLIL